MAADWQCLELWTCSRAADLELGGRARRPTRRRAGRADTAAEAALGRLLRRASNWLQGWIASQLFAGASWIAPSGRATSPRGETEEEIQV